MKTIQVQIDEQQASKIKMIMINYNLSNQSDVIRFLIDEKKIRIEEEL